MPSLVDLIKKAAVEAVAASKPVAIEYGKVTSISPLKIQVDQKRTLDSDFIIQTQIVAGLILGDRVAMIMAQGGQSYVVLDRVVG